ncbi:MAG: hypothetical protein AAFO73_11915, partial [Pseudomonadota bacterium]
QRCFDGVDSVKGQLIGCATLCSGSKGLLRSGPGGLLRFGLGLRVRGLSVHVFAARPRLGAP